MYPTTPDDVLKKFTGKERDAETGLDYFGARYFSGAQGRFTSPDWSAKPEPVPYANLEDPQTLNLYSYVRNNPMDKADADGHCFWDLCIGEGIATYAAATAVVATAAYLMTPQGKESLRAAIVGTGALINKAVEGVQSLVTKSEAKPSSPSQAENQPAPATANADAKPKSNPMTGEPGSTSTTKHASGDPKQVRRYGPDGHPETDVDHGHDHGQGDPHAHDWGRPTDGTPPTHVDRAPGRPLKPNDPQPQ
jgi:RHS repeat-associated protein